MKKARAEQASDIHAPVLLSESIDALAIKPDGIYVDCTFGRGGHSSEILKQLGECGKLLAIDKDEAALASDNCKQLLGDSRFEIEHGSFAKLGIYLKHRDWLGKVDGILMDLGVSSPQLDEAQRGFSFIHDGPLDLRMNQAHGESAAEWLAHVSESELKTVLRDLGEERFSGRIAHAIISNRTATPIVSTLQLASLVEQAVPRRERNKHPATRTFLAIRLQVNQELDELKQCLPQVVEALKTGGRMAVISFHSLEDRIVKRFIRDQSQPGDTGLMGCEPITNPPRLKKSGKIFRASASELKANPRSRSAILRIAERTSVCA
ncbi:MAG TPA: 16S rRNA (cytosine(1402)-N(4))-methyltransferase RsmH [Crenotrichaceae bacterium]|nr:16S rRNA (cytosine(1402)-N(4))-methyltransferase RsmH [Crenotrichaceae bacterium]